MPRRASVVSGPVHRRACLLTFLTLGCDRPTRRVPTDSVAPAASASRAPYGALRTRIAELRDEFAARRASAADETARRVVVNEARIELRSAIVDVLLPAWMGTRWSFHGTADEPRAPEGIACGYFVATVLQHAAVKLESRRRFGQSTALTIARSLVAAGSSHHHRIFSVPATALEQKVRSFGDGLYLIGLNVHVGFVTVRAGVVRVVHSSYLGPRTVVDEPIAASEAIERSREAGYHVTALLADNALTEAWLDGRTIALNRG
jgi:hypothetical protein